MTIEFKQINKYAVAISYGDMNLRLVTRVRTDDELNIIYRLSTYNEINEYICTKNTLGELLVLMDNIKKRGLQGSGGQDLPIGYVLIPVILNVDVIDCTAELDEANLSVKRERALSKLTNEDKLVLGI